MEGTAQVHFGGRPVPSDGRVASGRLVRAFGEDCYVIEDAQTLPPFLTSVVGDSDLWLFVASNGGVTAGRRSPATALFPYVTEDKLADSPGVTGPVTSLVVARAGRAALWNPLSEGDRLVHACRRRLYKNVVGTRLVFEEENEELGLHFRASWRTSHRFGVVRECTLTNIGTGLAEVRLLDGFLNLLPGDADEQLQQGLSSLLDAYKQSERVPGTLLALYRLAAQPVDLPEPKEALHASTVWSQGLAEARVHLTAEARRRFQHGLSIPPADEARGERGAYLLEATVALAPGAEQAWRLVADVARTQRDVVQLVADLREPERLGAEVDADLARGAARLAELLAATDGQQLTAARDVTAHHLSNVLFNDLRGGVYAHGMSVPGRDFAAFVRGANRVVAQRHAAFLASLPELELRDAHAARVEAVDDPDLSRLSAEYLPLCFSRRHGDPSRPWNRFDIRVRDARGEPILDYQGNWRDIFQNWEALSRSFPGFVEQILAKFVNASTIDGHNPYRIGRAGIDWEVPDAGHAWSTIGYWGDHQIVYLSRLLELSLEHDPAALPARLERAIYTYADVPYDFRPYAEITADPRHTIRFDETRHARALSRVRELGSDGRLLHDETGLVRVTLVEKLLVPLLAKLAQFIPGGGIWMNTQRPEWNDANNALAGYGVSVVTLCHLDRYLELVATLLAPLAGRETPISSEVACWLDATLAVVRAAPRDGSLEQDDAVRGRFVAALGTSAGDYRATVYRQGFSGRTRIPVDRILDLATRARGLLGETIARQRRDDGLYHAYDVLVPRGTGGGFGLQHLEEMLEGQVAALGTRAVDDEAACAMLDALFASRLYRADQRSFLLYPDRRLPTFLEKNVVPESALRTAPALARLVAAGDERVVVRDAAGTLRFQADLHSAEACAAALGELRGSGVELADEDVAAILEIYEQVFRHRAFTGRSGTMFAYEGLGSVYWHMVGKLVLAVQERYLDAAERGAPASVLERLAAHYESIRSGMGGAEKTPAQWGAFPLDAYSHTPAGAGARQPGMTGQVKEEILIRLGELGVRVRGGRLAFRPRLLRRTEFLLEEAVFEPIGLDGRRHRVVLPPGTLAFTLAQVPIVYHLTGDELRLDVVDADGGSSRVAGDTLDAARSAQLFRRTGEVRRIDVWTRPSR